MINLRMIKKKMFCFNKKQSKLILIGSILCLVSFLNILSVYQERGKIIQGESVEFDEDSISIPKSQGNISAIYDNIGQIWESSSTYLKCEDTMALKIYSKWNDTVNATLEYQEYTSSWGTSKYIGSNSNDTEYANFSIGINFGLAVSAVQFKIHVIESTGGNWQEESAWQPYDILGTSNPTIPSENANDYTYNCVDLGAGLIGIKINWANVFEDEVGIAYYQIARLQYVENVHEENPITDSNFNTYIITSDPKNPLYIDSSTLSSEKYWYAIKAVDYVNLKSTILTIDNPLYADLDHPILKDGSPKYLMNNTNEISSENPTIYVESNMIFKIECVEDDLDKANITIIYLEDNSTLEEYNLIPENDRNFIWISQEISLSSGRYLAGTYKILLTLEDKMNNVNQIVIEEAFTIATPVQQVDETDWVMMGGIIGGVAAALIIGIVLYRRREVEYEDDSDVEFTKEKQRKKKGEIYKGASSIGRKSGQAADLLQERRGKKPSSIKPSSTKPQAKKSTAGKSNKVKQVKKSSEKATVSDHQIKRVSTLKEKEISPEKDLDKIIAAKPTAMRMMQEERKVDIDRRMKFLVSKLDSLDQNMELMKLILAETGKLPIKSKDCPICGNSIAESWSQCPYCLINERIDEINTKIKSSAPYGQPVICPKCQKILDSTWSDCPFCKTKTTK